MSLPPRQFGAEGGLDAVYAPLLPSIHLPQVAVKALRLSFVMGNGTGDKYTRVMACVTTNHVFSNGSQMLRRELGIWKRLKHPNIVPFLGIAYGFGMEGVMSLVSLWMPNESLHKFLAKYNDNLDVAHRLQFVGLLNSVSSSSSDPS